MKLFFYNISNASEAELSEWFDSMSTKRKEAVKKLKIPQKQKLKIAADHICRKAISEFCSISPDEIKFDISEYGKPYVKGLNTYFSISHSGDFVVCAVSDKEIGIDIEKIREINPEVSKRFADENELDYINSHKNGLLEIWTLKEAYFKCIGTGLGTDIKNVSFEISESGVSCSEKSFECTFINIENGYICSVCERK